MFPITYWWSGSTSSVKTNFVTLKSLVSYMSYVDGNNVICTMRVTCSVPGLLRSELGVNSNLLPFSPVTVLVEPLGRVNVSYFVRQ